MRPEWRYRAAGAAARARRLPGRGLALWLCAAALAGLPPPARAQEPSANVRLVAAASAGDPAGMARALADGATANARNRLGESALLIALQKDAPIWPGRCSPPAPTSTSARPMA